MTSNDDVSLESEEETNVQPPTDEVTHSALMETDSILFTSDSDVQTVSNSIARIDSAEVKFEDVDNEEINVLTLEDEGALTAIQRMTAECPTDFTGIDLNYRFWRAFLIHTVTNVGDDVEILRERLDTIE